MKEKPYCIGIDLDNTLVCYDALFYRLACEQGLISSAFSVQKNAIRDHVRSYFGDLSWQKLQSMAYGPRIQEAQLFPYATEVLQYWQRHGYTLTIISHKTCTSSYDQHYNLRKSALKFLDSHGVLDIIDPQHIYFLSTRAKKISEIERVGCTLFIDDLVEVLRDKSFPQATAKILFSSHLMDASLQVYLCSSWKEVQECSDVLLSK